MPAINATIVVESTNLSITPTTTNLGVTVDAINLGVYTTSPTPVGGSAGQLQYNDRNVTFGGVANTSFASGNLTFSNLGNLKIDGGVNAYYLQTDGTGNLTWAAGGTPTGSGVPSGANTQIQLSDGSGSFASGPGFTFDNVSNIFTTPGKAEIAGNLDVTPGSVYNGDGSGLYNIQAGNVVGLSLSQIANGTSNVDIATVDGNIEMNVNGSLRGKVDSLGYVGDIRTGNLALTSTFAPLGLNAGTISAPTFGVAIGTGAGEVNLGDDSIAIGRGAGNLDQADNSIVLNATGANVTTSQTDSFIVKPIRQGISTSKILYYNDTTGEITNDGISSFNVNKIVNGTSNVDIASTDGNINYNVGGANVARMSTTGDPYPGVLAVNGNITAQNDIESIGGNIVVTAGQFVGDGGGISNLSISTSSISNGTSNVDIATADGSVTVGVGGVADVLTITTTGANVTGTLNATGVITGSGLGLNQLISANIVGTIIGAGASASNPTGAAILGNSAVTTGIGAVAVGDSAGASQQSVAIGPSARAIGLFGQSIQSGVAIGLSADATQNYAIAIGDNAMVQGQNGIGIGELANVQFGHSRSIVLNATGSLLDSTAQDTFHVKPVRNAGASGLPAGFQQVAYNPTTGEFVYYS
jgi:hypothetical protein|tara:strand:+ start:95 stop:2017 length:1923 start_codon:yes stop_codon:yes gene_type:complete